MKAIVLVDIPDDYEEYGSGDWYIVGDDLRIVYEEDGALMHYKYIDDDMAQLKPLPQYKSEKRVYGGYCAKYEMGYDDCLDEILGEENE